MPQDYVLKNLNFDPYQAPKGDPYGMTHQSPPKSPSICYMSINTEYMCKF